jgi:hypothetical protein
MDRRDLLKLTAVAPLAAIMFEPEKANAGNERTFVAWVDRRMTPMPLKSYDTPLVLDGAPGGSLPKRFIRCTQPALPNIEPSARYAREHGWKYAELPTGHDAMVSMPKEVAAMLLAG